MTKLVGILNVTPDSFSDGGTLAPDAVLVKAEQLIAQGVDVLDVGAESTRPDATPLTHAQEWARLSPVWAGFVEACKGITLSLDTRHADTAARALEVGCDWVNDVSGFHDTAMLDVVRDAECKLVVMHSLSVPAVRGEAVATDDICAFMRDWIAQTKQRLAGIAPERLIFDGGIGFGKSARQSWELLVHLNDWKGDDCVLVGHSRKRFLSVFSEDASQRDTLTRMSSAMLAAQGADYLRVHDVAGHRAMLEALA
jgi:dihydropteroate synthase